MYTSVLPSISIDDVVVSPWRSVALAEVLSCFVSLAFSCFGRSFVLFRCAWRGTWQGRGTFVVSVGLVAFVVCIVFAVSVVRVVFVVFCVFVVPVVFVVFVVFVVLWCLGAVWTVWGTFRAVKEAFWSVSGASGTVLGTFLGRQGSLLGAEGTPWAIKEAFWTVLGAAGPILGTFWAAKGAVWEVLGCLRDP
jgi:hypothetical protein